MKPLSVKTKISVFLGCLLPLIPIFLLFIFYYPPKATSPSIIPLTGNWQARYGKVEKTVTFPGLFYSMDGNGLITDFIGQTWEVVLQKKVVLKDSMIGEDLFLMICGTIFQTGKIMLNGELVGNIGVYHGHRKFGTAQGIDGFFIAKKSVRITNELTLYLQSDDLPSFGLNDHRLFLGVDQILRPYYERNLFLNNLFNLGVVFLAVFMLIILTIILTAEWKSPDRSKYLIAGLYMLSSLSYNLFYSGSFVNYVLPIVWLDTGIIMTASLVVLSNMEFIYSNFVLKPGPVGKAALWVNRVICLGSFALYPLLTYNNYLLNMVWNGFSFYIVVSLLFGLVAIIRSIFKKANPFGMVMGFANLILIFSAINDVLSNQAIINTPLIVNVGISMVTIIGTIIVIAEIIKINNALKDYNRNLEVKVEERTRELQVAYTNLDTTFRSVQSDLRVAHKIQNNMLPKTVNHFKHLDFDIQFIPMGEVGGDIYDITEMIPGYYRIFLADATGHGIQAALITMIIKSEYEKFKSLIQDPGELLEFLNEEFINIYGSFALFYTCFVADIDMNKGKIVYCSAAHPDQFLIRNGSVIALSKCGKPVGVIEKSAYVSKSIPFQEDFKLILFTDGLIEEFSKTGEEFGEVRLFKTVETMTQMPVHDLCRSVMRQVNEFMEVGSVNDDITLIGIEKKRETK